MTTSRINVLDDEGLPPAGVEYRLAHHFLAQPGATATRALYLLVARPSRFRDLREALSLKSDNSLTVALHTLREEGLIEQRIDAARKPATYWYELSSLGVEVLFLMQHFAYLEAERRHQPSPMAAI